MANATDIMDVSSDATAADVISQALCLAENSLYVIGGSAPVDGRVSWYAHEHLGRYVPFNSYLLKEENSLFLVESAVPIVFEQVARQLRAIANDFVTIPRLAVTRNEPDCVSNIPSLVRQFGLNKVYSPGLMNTLQFFRAQEVEPEASFNHRSTELQMLNFGVTCEPAVSGQQIRVAGNRTLDIIAVPLRVLPTIWLYDRKTRTMFCSDSFSDETSIDARTKAISSLDERKVLIARMKRHFSGKFDWMFRSDLKSVIEDTEKIFASYDIETLAPSRGLVIRGRLAVEAKIAALMAALKSL